MGFNSGFKGLRSFTPEQKYDHDAVNNEVNRSIHLMEQLARGGHASRSQNHGSAIIAGRGGGGGGGGECW